MRGKVLLIVRRLHLYLSVFFAPLLLVFIVTGWAQTMDFDHSSALLANLSQVHTRQLYPSGDQAATLHNGHYEAAGKYKIRIVTFPMKWLTAAMCVALLTSISLGLILAFTMVRNRIPVWIALNLGVGIPTVLLFLAHFT